MTNVALPALRVTGLRAGALYPATVFMSAALVFLVEPMMGRLTLPLLGGGSGVWNASLAFFQIALLVGYLYAHALQRVRSVRDQTLIHIGVLALAACVLPLHLSGWLGDPPTHAPVLWLLAVLTLSIGAPFAALSATAPLLQAWRARRADGGAVYGLYAASNLGSLLALGAYPLVVEPNLRLADQRLFWTLGYGVFVALAAALALVNGREDARPAPLKAKAAAPPAHARWRERAGWVLLAAAPSSLMLGATTHLSSDVGSAPFLWVVPLGLYLLTFILAFRDGGERSGPTTRNLHVVAVLACTAALPIAVLNWSAQLALDLGAFWLTALVCHRALYARRPDASRLTEFYLLVSVGGVVGGGFNAFAAPLIFNQVWEYPLVLVLACLARPNMVGAFSRAERLTLAVGVAALLAAAAMALCGWLPTVGVVLAVGAAGASAWLLRARTIAFTGVAAGWTVVAQLLLSPAGGVHAERSFFGVHRVSTAVAGALGPVRRLTHGSTLHGAQRLSGPDRCTPLTYYGSGTPIRQAFSLLHARRSSASIGVVGLGAGSVAALTSPGDTLRFFEIDPAVVRIARDEHLFDFVGPCAAGRIQYALGDGRLLLAHAPAQTFDMLLVDAFSSDSVPTHLLTTEALRTYLRTLKPDGVLVLHLTNRNLRLVEPAAAAVRDVGAVERVRVFLSSPSARPAVESSTAMVVARDSAALDAFDRSGWRPAAPSRVRAWTDDYVNIFGALIARVRNGPDRP